MSVNVLGQINEQLTDAVIDKAANFLGESSQKVKIAFDCIAPSLLASMVPSALSESGRLELFNLIGQGSHDGQILDNLPAIFDGGAFSNRFLNEGDQILDTLLYDRTGSMIDLVAETSKLKRSSSSSLLKMTAPIVLGTMGKHIKTEGLNATGLSKMLLAQLDELKKAAPQELAAALGIPNIDHLGESPQESSVKVAVKTKSEQRSIVKEVSETDGSLWNKFLPLLLFGLIAFLVFYFFNGCGDQLSKTIDGVKPVQLEETRVDPLEE